MATITLTVQDAFTPLDLLLFRHFKREVPGLVEATFAKNQGLADLGAFLPVGTHVLVDEPAPATRNTRPLITLWSTAAA